jgi:hypothetical protein
MRDISTLTKEEIAEFFNALDIGEFEINEFDYDKDNKTFEVSTVTQWDTDDDEGNIETIDQEDMWYFTNNSYDSNYPERIHSMLYYEFLLAKGFKENRFIVK